MNRNVAILIFDGVEVLDFAGPFEVFNVAGKITAPPPFTAYTVAAGEAVRAQGGLTIVPHYRLADCPPPDLLLVPGGQGTRPLLHDTVLLNWIRQQAARAELLLSVCTGSLLLGKAGLLDGLAATTHHSAFDLLREQAPTATVHEDRRFVDNGRVLTSGGISAGIDMALHTVARLEGKDHARATAAYMEYPYSPNS